MLAAKKGKYKAIVHEGVKYVGQPHEKLGMIYNRADKKEGATPTSKNTSERLNLK